MNNIGNALAMLGVLVLYIYAPPDPVLWAVYLVIGSTAFATWVYPGYSDLRKEQYRLENENLMLENKKLIKEIKILEEEYKVLKR